MKYRPRVRSSVCLLIAALLVLSACGDNKESSAPTDENLGGETTRIDESRNAFGQSASNLSNEEKRRFEQGNSFFTQNWVTAPASTTSRDGLGPMFNAQACASCHEFDGRGLTPENPDDTATRGLLVRLSIPGTTPNGGPVPEPNYGDQLQDKSIQGVTSEGRVSVDYSNVDGQYGDGSKYSLRKPSYAFKDLAYGPMRPDVMTSPRIAPQMVGMGLLEAIPELQILANADPDDKNGDGISGRPNYPWNPLTQSKQLGRFGWKANQATVETQVSGAFHGDIGITSTQVPNQECTTVQTDCKNAINGGDPEIDDERLATVVFYSRTLAVPAMRNVKAKDVKKGAQAFMEMGCATCHTPTYKTGDHPIKAVANQDIHPFTDLLLHDMGAELADGRPDFDANGQEWRTPPLWGIGLIDNVNSKRFLLHDGRAKTIEEAILWHGGEATKARETFRLSSSSQRAALIKYLESL